MRLLIYSTDFAPSTGGVQSVVMTLASGIAKHRDKMERVQCTVVTRTAAQAFSDDHLPFGVVRNPSIRGLIRLILDSDILHLVGPSATPLALGLLLRKKIVVEHHGFQAVCPNGLLFHEPTETACPGYFLARRHLECWECNKALGWSRSLKLWLLTLFRRAGCMAVDANVAPTDSLVNILILPRTDAVLHGVENLPLVPYNSPNPVPTFAFIGRLVSTKGLTLLFRAAGELKAKGRIFRLLIIGEGPERNRAGQLSRELGIADLVEFAGYVPEQQLPDLLRAVLAVVVPSIAGEVFGLVVAESMMRGRLVIVPDCGALAEVAGNVALKFVPNDELSLASCMEHVLISPQDAVETGRRARLRSLDKFRADRMIDDHLSLYQQVLR